jgi:hypothetical protein
MAVLGLSYRPFYESWRREADPYLDYWSSTSVRSRRNRLASTNSVSVPCPWRQFCWSLPMGRVTAFGPVSIAGR